MSQLHGKNHQALFFDTVLSELQSAWNFLNWLFVCVISISCYTSVSTEENLNCSALNSAVSTKDLSSTWWLDLPSESLMRPISTPSLRIWNVEYLASNASNVLGRPSSYGCQCANVVRRRSLNWAGVRDIICNFIIRAPCISHIGTVLLLLYIFVLITSYDSYRARTNKLLFY